MTRDPGDQVTIEHAIVQAKRNPWGSSKQTGPDGLRALLAYPGPHVNSGALRELRQAPPEQPRPKTQEVQAWSL